MGLLVLASEALPHVANAPLSDLYPAPGATAADQASLVIGWQATQGIFNALLVAGLAILPIGAILLGVAMFGDPAFGKVIGWVSVGLGVAGLAAAIVLLVDPLSPIAVVGVFALILFHLVVGWKLYRVSMAPRRAEPVEGRPDREA